MRPGATRQNDEVGELGKALDTLGDKLLVASKESAQLDQLRKISLPIFLMNCGRR